MWNTVATVEKEPLAIVIALYFVVQFLTAYRWYFILHRLHQLVPFVQILYYSIMGQASALLLPGQLSGDIVKLMAISYDRPGKAAFALSVVVDKLSVLIAIAALALFGTIGWGPVSKLAKLSVGASAILAIVIPCLVVVCRIRTIKLPHHQTVIRSERLLWLCRYPLRVLKESSSLPRLSVGDIIVVVMLALMLQIASTAGAYFVAASVNIRIDPIDWLAINSIISLVQILPLTVGGLGTREGVFGAILGLYAIPITQAVTLSLIGFGLFVILTSLCWFVLSVLLTRKKTARL